MDQRLLIFVTVAEKQNFSRAAEELHVTQPAVSQHIQSLERAVGARLLERSNKYVRLTKAGEIVYHHAQDILRTYTQMQRLIDDITKTASGTLSIGASYTFGEYILPHIVARFRTHYPNIVPNISIDNTEQVGYGIMHRNLDLGIVEGRLAVSELNVDPLAEDTMLIIVSAKHRLANAKMVSAAELSEETWIVRESGSGTRSRTERFFRDNQLSPANMMEFSSTQVIKEAVEAGLGIGLVSEWAIRKECALDTLRPLQIQNYPVTRQFYLVTHVSKFRTKAMDLFIDYIKTKMPVIGDFR